MTTPRQWKAAYAAGKNISELLRRERGVEHNTKEIIEIAYDLQTGSYIDAMRVPAMANHKRDYAALIAETVQSLCQPRSILEAGIGEATTLAGVLPCLEGPVDSYGFDLSWSRVAYARHWLHAQGIDQTTQNQTTLCTGDLAAIPFADNAIDVVYTSHSIEPNGGDEQPILQELFRITRRFLVLLEPGYELAGPEARRRMETHGYCRNLRGYAEALGYEVVRHELFPLTANPLNPTALTIIRKEAESVRGGGSVLACPQYKTPLEMWGGMLFSPEALVAYPVLDGIPCLRGENGIFASKFQEVARSGQGAAPAITAPAITAPAITAPAIRRAA